MRRRAAGLELEVDSSRGAARLPSALIGDFNVDNLLTVLAVLLAWDLPLQRACAALARCSAAARAAWSRKAATRRPAGDRRLRPHARCARQGAARGARALPRAAAGACSAAAAIATPASARDGPRRRRAADELIVTDDNPRSEDPQRIVAAILAGMTEAGALARARVDS